MAKRIGAGRAPTRQGRGLRKQVPTGVVVAAIALLVVIIGFIVWRTGVVGGPMKVITPEMRAAQNNPAYTVRINPETGMSYPSSDDVKNKLEKTEDWTPSAEKFKPK